MSETVSHAFHQSPRHLYAGSVPESVRQPAHKLSDLHKAHGYGVKVIFILLKSVKRIAETFDGFRNILAIGFDVSNSVFILFGKPG